MHDHRAADTDESLPLLTMASVGLFVIFSFAVLWAASVVFIPIALAVLLSYAMHPIQRSLTRAGLPSAMAAAVVMFTLVGATGTAVYGVRGQVTAFVDELPDAFRRVSSLVSRPGDGAISRVREAAKELERASADATQAPPAPRGVTRVQVETTPLSFTDLMWKSTGGAITFAGQALVVVVLVFYFLAADDLFKRKFVRIADTFSDKRLTVEILNDIERHIARYLAARLLISIIVATATTVAFWWLGMSQPAAWGIIAGILNIIPYVGPTAVTFAAMVAGFLQSGSVEHAVWIGVAETAIGVTEGFVITPVLMGRAGRMNGAAVFISLTIWGFLWGLWGLLLAVPLTMALKVVCDRVEALAPVAELLGE